MRSGKPGVDHRRQVEHCLRLGQVAIGWGVLEQPPTTLEETLERVREFPASGWGSRAAGTIRRFADAEWGSLIWSRHPDGTWLLGELKGAWRPDYSPAACAVDAHQVRDVLWAPRRLYSEEVPGSVIRAFSGRGSSFSEIHNENGRLFSAALFAELTGSKIEKLGLTPEQILQDFLDPFDVEDLVFSYLQVERGYLVLPASRRTNNPTYEYAVVEREGGRLVPVSVKTGATFVDVGQLASTAEAGGKAVAYSTEGNYMGDGSGRVELIDNAELLRFARSSTELLPPRVRRWFRYAGSRPRGLLRD
jgi:hypothetical protein